MGVVRALHQEGEKQIEHTFIMTCTNYMASSPRPWSTEGSSRELSSLYYNQSGANLSIFDILFLPDKRSRVLQDGGRGRGQPGFFPRAEAMIPIKSGIDTSSPSAMSNVRLAASGCFRHKQRRSAKLDTPARLRRFLMDAKGSGVPLSTSWINLRKLAFTPGPYVRGGRTMTCSRPVSFETRRKHFSASHLETA